MSVRTRAAIFTVLMYPGLIWVWISAWLTGADFTQKTAFTDEE